jgi:hypothetical protein
MMGIGSDEPTDAEDQHDRRDEATRRLGARRPSGPAWRTVASVWAGQDEGSFSPAELERLRPLDRSTDRNTDAEYGFYRLHGRFLRYAEEYLFPDERILAFVPWTSAVSDTWRTRLRRVLAPGARQAREGLLLVTGRQVLLLRDDVEPVGGSFFAGYAVHATTYERLAGVEFVATPQRQAVLRLSLAAGTSRESVAWTFPAAATEATRQAAALLAGFPPRSDEHRPRAPGRIVPRWRLAVPSASYRNRPAHHHVEDEATRQARVRLQPVLDEVLRTHPGPDGEARRVYVAAVVPGERGGHRLAALTQEHLLLVTPPGDEAAVVQPLAEVTSVELRRTVLGPEVAWIAGEAGERRIVVMFPPVAMEQCLDVFAVARQALTLLPVEAAGPDLPAEDDADDDARSDRAARRRAELAGVS